LPDGAEPAACERGAARAVEADIKKQEDVAQPLLQAVEDREIFTKLIDDIHSRLPNEFVWVTGYERQKDAPGAKAATPPPKGGKAAAESSGPPRPTFLVRGLYMDPAVNPDGANIVDKFVDKLNESPLYSVDKSKMIRVTPTDTEWAYDYSFPLVLKGPEPEPTEKDKGAKKPATP
jgi:hypothetical protein